MTSQIQVKLNLQSISQQMLRGGRTAPKHCGRDEEWVVPQRLGWSSHLFAYEFTPRAKPSQAAFKGQYPVECSAFLWILTNLPLIYRFDSQWIFVMWPQSLNFISFGRAWVPGESRSTGGKSSGKNLPRNPLHSPPENLLNIWPVLTVSLVWSLAQRRESPVAAKFSKFTGILSVAL